MHAEIERKGLLDENIILGNAVIDMYCQCGFVEEAEHLFSSLRIKDIVSWNVLIAGYTEHEQGQEAMECFEMMHLEGDQHNAIAFVSMLKVCRSMQVVGRNTCCHCQRGNIRKRSTCRHYFTRYVCKIWHNCQSTKSI